MSSRHADQEIQQYCGWGPGRPPAHLVLELRYHSSTAQARRAQLH